MPVTLGISTFLGGPEEDRTPDLLTAIQSVPMKVVQMILRHSDFKVTANTYSHIMIDEQREALEKIF
jgi:uncharacterized protein YaaQ